MRYQQKRKVRRAAVNALRNLLAQQSLDAPTTLRVIKWFQRLLVAIDQADGRKITQALNEIAKIFMK